MRERFIAQTAVTNAQPWLRLIRAEPSVNLVKSYRKRWFTFYNGARFIHQASLSSESSRSASFLDVSSSSAVINEALPFSLCVAHAEEGGGRELKRDTERG